jgi:uncharacterized membrane protein YbhN (UPF0104 family)/tRNA A-37 threonylcarbamoyl transferase component Bud32
MTAAETSIGQTLLSGTRARRSYVRSPVDLLRLIVGGVLLVLGIGTTNVADNALLGLSEDGAEAIERLPDWVHAVPAAAMAVAVLTAVTVALAWSLLTTRYRRFALLAGAFIGGAALSLAMGELIDLVVDGPVRASFEAEGSLFRYQQSDGRLLPGDPLLAGAVAMLVVSASYLRRRITQRLVIVLAVYAALSILTAGVPALGLVTDIGAGLFVGSAALLAFGRHDLAPDAYDITLALHSIGLDVDGVEHLAVDARGSAPWVGTASNGDKVFVKALGRDERSADLMFRAYRWVRLRKTGDHRPFDSLRRAVEHEALVSLQAAALGIRTPRILGVAEAGVDGMVLAYEAIDGASIDTLDDIDDEALESVWTMVSKLHARRIAHRDLRLANIFLDTEKEPWMIDFGFSELAASDQLLGTDVAELLASTTTMVGTERAVGAAHRASGLSELERAMPWLQPLALSTATRQAVGGEKGLVPIRDMLVDQCGVPAEAQVKLQRISGKTIFMIATIGLSGWFLIPQLADIDDVWGQAGDASVNWFAMAVFFSGLTYVAATAALLGAIPMRLKFGQALIAQIASSFANRVTPAKVGGVAVNIRYFQRQGVQPAVGITAVGLNAVAGMAMHVSLTIGFLFLASGDESSEGLALPSTAVILVAFGFVALAILLSVVVPFTRRVLVSHVVPQLQAGWVSIRILSHSPGRLALLLGGSALITLAYLAAMVASLEAFGSTTSVPLIAVLFLTASALANAAPTPGGLGAAEAALIAAFSTVEDADVAVPAVFLYRLVTFWLPILPGWAALTYLRRSNKI